jgi:hypothetical protein
VVKLMLCVNHLTYLDVLQLRGHGSRVVLQDHISGGRLSAL